MTKLHYTLLAILLLPITSLAQDDLLGELEAEAEEVVVNQPAFKAMKIGNLQSTKVAAKGDLYMYVSHRFGTIKNGFDTFFGLDDANTKIQLVYGVSERLQLGASRESWRKTLAGSAKFRVADQKAKFPLNVVLYSTLNYNSEVSEDRYPFLESVDRLSYAHQLLLSRRFSNKFSFELAPSLVRQNLVYEVGQDHDQLVLGLGGRYKVTKRTSINADYAYNLSRVEDTAFNDPLTIGVDIETGGHVFQLLFSNAQSTNEPGFLSNAVGDWSDGDIFFGFNIVRVF